MKQILKNFLIEKINDLEERIVDKRLVNFTILDKDTELKIFFDMINPIVQNYMNEKSIDILFNSNHIFMGNKNSDLTKQLINEINKKINN